MNSDAEPPPPPAAAPHAPADWAARLGGAEILRRRLAKQEELENNPEADEGFVNVQSLLRKGRVVRGILSATGLAGVGRRNMLAVRREENILRVRGLPAAFRGQRVLHLSDLHADMDPGMAPAIVRAIAGWEYDAVMLTGDYRARTRWDWQPALAACREVTRALRPGAPIFASLGNHDPLEMIPGLEELGWRVLLNESTPWTVGGETLWVAGVDDDHTYQTADVAHARAGIPPGACALLLSHTPATYARAAAAGFAAFLCGHTHGGQICLPGGRVLLHNTAAPRWLSHGPWEYQGMTGYTSRGAGTCRVPARFFCPPEVTRHTLEGK